MISKKSAVKWSRDEMRSDEWMNGQNEEEFFMTDSRLFSFRLAVYITMTSLAQQCLKVVMASTYYRHRDSSFFQRLINSCCNPR